MAEIEGYGLLENPCVTVEYNDNQSWTAMGTRYNADSCGRIFDIVESCTAPLPSDLSPDLAWAAPGYKVTPFGLLERQKTSVQCTPAELSAVEAALECATEYLVANALWYGGNAPGLPVQGTGAGWDQNIFIESSDVGGTTASATPTNDWTLEAALGQLLEEAYAAHPELGCCSIIHLGAQAGIALSGPIKRLGLNVVISPAYPSLGLAITGPISVVLGKISSNQNMNSVPRDNKVYADAVRLAAFAFDPCLAKRKEYS